MAKKMTRRDAEYDSGAKEWTVMVYMAAGDSSELDTVAVRDLREMEKGTRGNKNVNVVVQMKRHWPDSVQRCTIENGKSVISNPSVGCADDTDPTACDGNGVPNMGHPKTLTDFLQWAVGNSKAKHHLLVLWGHAYGLGFGRDHGDPLTLAQLRMAIEKFQKGRDSLDMIGTNACAMSYLEAAFELRDCARYLVASQITVPFAGWPYDAILSRIGDNTEPEKLAHLIVDSYVTQFRDLPGADRLSMSLLKLEAANGIEKQLETLATEIRSDVTTNGFDDEKLSFYRDIFLAAPAGDTRPLLDLTALCDALSGDPDDPIPGKVGQAARALRETLHETKGKLVAHHRRHPDLIDLNGIGIYAPFVTDSRTLQRLELHDEAFNGNGSTARRDAGRGEYNSLKLFGPVIDGQPEKTWPALVYNVLRRDIPADLVPSIDGIASLHSGDRADVAQIILAIDSSLNKLDRTLSKAKEEILAGFDNTGASNGGTKPKGKAQAKARNAPAIPHTFGPPWLKLLPSLNEARITSLKQARDFRDLNSPAVTPAPSAPIRSSAIDPRKAFVGSTARWLGRLERTLREVERTTRRGLSHVRFGLGPASPGQTGLGELPKSGEGELPKSGEGELPKSGEGESNGNGIAFSSAMSGDLRGDLALTRVADLFRQVGQSLQQLEQTLAGLEAIAREVLVDSMPAHSSPQYSLAAAAQEIERAFHIMEEASVSTRRTVRRVMAHPIYGLGPAEQRDLTLDVRLELASRGGLDKRHLRLL